jgi:hypothetical protein
MKINKSSKSRWQKPIKRPSNLKYAGLFLSKFHHYHHESARIFHSSAQFSCHFSHLERFLAVFGNGQAELRGESEYSSDRGYANSREFFGLIKFLL